MVPWSKFRVDPQDNNVLTHTLEAEVTVGVNAVDRARIFDIKDQTASMRELSIA